MLTSAQRKRLAREARKLAMECVEGTAPQLIVGMFSYRGRHCALGEVAFRAGFVGESETWAAFYGTVAWSEEAAVAACENNNATDADRHPAVVFPLLALADALEEA